MKLRFLLLPILAGLGIALPAAGPVPTLRSDLPLKAYAAQVATTARPVLEFTLPEHAEPGNWGVSDFWGRLIGSGTTAAGIRTLQLPTPGPGHYRLTWTTAKTEIIVPFSVVSADIPEASASSPFGIATHLAQGWEPDCVTLARAAGFSWIRDEAYWSTAESAKGKFDFQTVTAKRLRDASESIHPILCLGYGNRFYDRNSAPQSAEALDAWQRYVRGALEAFPQISMIEAWNEFNCGSQTGETQPTPANYLKLLRATWEAAKATRPDCEVLGGATSTLPIEWLENLFKLGGLAFMDIVTVHPYRWGEWARPPETLYPDLVRLRQLVERHAKGKPVRIIVDEIGWPVDDRFEITESRQAAFFVRTYANLMRAGVEKTVWYSLMKPPHDREEFAISVLTPDRRFLPRPAYSAAAAMTRELAKAEFLGEEKTPPPALGMRFRSPRGPLLLLWNPESKPLALELDAASPLQVTDLMGETTEVTPHNGHICLILAEFPVYVHGKVDRVRRAETVALDLKSAAIPLGDRPELNFRAPAGTLLRLNGRDLTPGINRLAPEKQPGTLNRRGELIRDGSRIGLAFWSWDIRPQLTVPLVRLDGWGTLLAELNNLAPDNPRRLTAAAAELDGKKLAPPAALPFLLPEQRRCEIRIPAEKQPPYRRLPYSLRMDFEEHPAVAVTGTTGYYPCFHRDDIVLDGKLDEWRSWPAIDLKADGNRVSIFPGGMDRAGSFGGKVWIAWNRENFYLAAEIDDPVHVQVFPVWEGDSLQFGLARAVPASADTKVEFAAAFNAKGTGWIFPEGPPGFDADTLRKYSRLRMKQEGSRSIYELEIPWKHLRFVRPQDGVFRFSLLANNNDGERRLGYLEWGAGIGRTKDPANYPVCVFVK